MCIVDFGIISPTSVNSLLGLLRTSNYKYIITDARFSAYTHLHEPRKFNSNNQYEESGRVGHLSSSSGQLQREIFLTTLGMLHRNKT